MLKARIADRKNERIEDTLFMMGLLRLIWDRSHAAIYSLIQSRIDGENLRGRAWPIPETVPPME
jgi:hypothetical protein